MCKEIQHNNCQGTSNYFRNVKVQDEKNEIDNGGEKGKRQIIF